MIESALVKKSNIEIKEQRSFMTQLMSAGNRASY